MDTPFSIDNTANRDKDFAHGNCRRLQDPSMATRPPGEGARRSEEEIRGIIARTEGEGSKRELGKGQESGIFAVYENAVLKEILPKGFYSYNASGKLIRTKDAALLAEKV
jgi:hypothetical protein